MQNMSNLSNLQLELLQLFARNVDEKDLLEIKLLIAKYFAQKATELTDKIWEEKKLTSEMILNSHRRTTYKSQSK